MNFLPKHRSPVSSRTDFLFVQPSFLRGVARTFDLFGSLEEWGYNFSRSTTEADYRALRSDWSVVGKDLMSVVQAQQEDLDRVQLERG